MTYVIKSDIPVPARANHRRGKPRVYPFPDMKVGDSFKFNVALQKKVRGAAQRFRHLSGKTVRFLVQDGHCWRVE